MPTTKSMESGQLIFISINDAGNGKPAIAQIHGVDYYIQAFWNAQLHSAVSQTATASQRTAERK